MEQASTTPVSAIGITAFVLIMGLAACSGRGPLGGLQARLPTAIGGWVASEADEVYDTESVFSYIDGHAEVYLAYGMTECLARRYDGPGDEAAVVLDVFRMGCAEDAYGVFTHDIEGDPVDVGQGGLVYSGWMRFWKGPFFVSVYAEDDTAGTREAVAEVARTVAAVIPEEGERPAIVASLPDAGLEEGSVRYFRNHQILNGIVYLGAEDVFGLGGQVPAVLGEYHRGGDAARLLVVEYRSAEAAEVARGRFATLRGVAGAEARPQRTDDGTWWGVATVGNRLVAVVDSSDESLAAGLLADAVGRPVAEGRTS